MVPYVRKSFYKHFLDGLKYIENVSDTKYNDESWSIEDIRYKEYSKAYEYALDKTIKETHQAVEGMYHNLNYWGD